MRILKLTGKLWDRRINLIKIGWRIYFDSITGSIILDIPEQVHYGERFNQTVERDIECFTQLSERNRETFDVIEVPFGMYRQDFAECIGYWIDVEAMAELSEDRRYEAIRFEMPNPEDPENPIVPDKPLSVEIEELKQENILLKAKNQALKETTDFHEELIVELAMAVYS